MHSQEPRRPYRNAKPYLFQRFTVTRPHYFRNTVAREGVILAMITSCSLAYTTTRAERNIISFLYYDTLRYGQGIQIYTHIHKF